MCITAARIRLYYREEFYVRKWECEVCFTCVKKIVWTVVWRQLWESSVQVSGVMLGNSFVMINMETFCHKSSSHSNEHNITFLKDFLEISWHFRNWRSVILSSPVFQCTGCFRVYRTVEWVAYRPAWARGTRGERIGAPHSLPWPTQSARQPNRLSCKLWSTRYTILASDHPFPRDHSLQYSHPWFMGSPLGTAHVLLTGREPSCAEF